MRDRIPGAPGRYSAIITGDDYQKLQNGEQFLMTLTRDDKPIENGTPYSKAAVLPDDVANALCPTNNNPTPADAFRALSCDFIVEQGVSENLRWRKWSSGFAEIWCFSTQDRYYYDSEEDEQEEYHDYITADLPFRMYLTHAFAHAFCSEDNGEGDISWVGINTNRPYIKNQQIVVEFELASIYKIMTIEIDAYIVGTWK